MFLILDWIISVGTNLFAMGAGFNVFYATGAISRTKGGILKMRHESRTEVEKLKDALDDEITGQLKKLDTLFAVMVGSKDDEERLKAEKEYGATLDAYFLSNERRKKLGA
jgi:hypothetical protein